MRLTASLIAMAMLAPVPALASPIADVICDTTPKMRAKLEHQFGNNQQAVGVRSPDQVMEVWTSPRGSWTLVLTYSTGRSCIVAMGDHWQETLRDPA